jgi:hypothetical protein
MQQQMENTVSPGDRKWKLRALALEQKYLKSFSRNQREERAPRNEIFLNLLIMDQNTL